MVKWQENGEMGDMVHQKSNVSSVAQSKIPIRMGISAGVGGQRDEIGIMPPFNFHLGE